MHPTLTKRTLQVFTCNEIGVGTDVKHLATDLHMRCTTAQHYGWVAAVGMPMLAGYVFGIPIMFFVALHAIRKKLSWEEVRFKYGFVYLGFKDEMYFWEITVMLRKAAIISIGVFLETAGIRLQTLCAIFVMAIAAAMHIHWKPYESPTLDKLERYSIVCAFITLYAGMFFYEGVPPSVRIFFTMCLVLLNSAYLTYMFMQISKIAMQSEKAKLFRAKAGDALGRMSKLMRGSKKWGDTSWGTRPEGLTVEEHAKNVWVARMRKRMHQAKRKRRGSLKDRLTGRRRRRKRKKHKDGDSKEGAGSHTHHKHHSHRSGSKHHHHHHHHHHDDHDDDHPDKHDPDKIDPAERDRMIKEIMAEGHAHESGQPKDGAKPDLVRKATARNPRKGRPSAGIGRQLSGAGLGAPKSQTGLLSMLGSHTNAGSVLAGGGGPSSMLSAASGPTTMAKLSAASEIDSGVDVAGAFARRRAQKEAARAELHARLTAFYRAQNPPVVILQRTFID